MSLVQDNRHRYPFKTTHNRFPWQNSTAKNFTSGRVVQLIARVLAAIGSLAQPTLPLEKFPI